MLKKNKNHKFIILGVVLVLVIILALFYWNYKINKHVSAAKQNFTIVSGFFDIGRSEWQGFSRKTELYVKGFNKYLVYPYKIVLFVDDRYVDMISKPTYCDLTIIPINKEWLYSHSKSWLSLERVRNIMKSDQYTTLVKKRIENNNPENTSPEYNIITSSKIDFINHAIENNLISTKYVVWGDFGYFNSCFDLDERKFPACPISLKELDAENDKLNFWLANGLEPIDEDMIHTLVTPKDAIASGIYTGTVQRMQELYVLYHAALEDMYSKGVADDDQHVYLRCYYANPSIFKLHKDPNSNDWPVPIKSRQKKYENIKDLVRDYMLYRNKNNSFVLSSDLLTNDLTVIENLDKLKENHSDLILLLSAEEKEKAFTKLNQGGILLILSQTPISPDFHFILLKDGSGVSLRFKY